MNLLFYLGHPAHYHLFKNVIKNLEENGHIVSVLIKKKDVLENLLHNSGHKYHNIQPKGRKDGKIFIAFGLLRRDINILKFCLKNRPDIMIGTSAEIAHVGKILGIPSVNVNEDDFDAVPLYSKLGFPWSNVVLVPKSCKTGKWEDKTVHYDGYHELAYLHPGYFKPEKSFIEEFHKSDKPFFILRFAKLTAHHDTGKSGITTELAQKIISVLERRGKIYITSERELEPEFESYRINIDPINIHHVLYYANMYIGDSQTMAAEAAVLGTPSLRFNDFVGKLGYLEELEHEYGLTYGIKTSEPEKLLQKIEKLLETPNLKQEWQNRRQKMLSEKIDVTAFMVWFIENYPASLDLMKEKSDVMQQQFMN